MKVLFVINSSNNGGAMKMIVTLYREIKKSHPSSRIVFLKKIRSQYSDIEDAYYLTENLESAFDYFRTAQKLHQIFTIERPDATISFLPLSNILSAVIGKRIGVKIRVASQRNPPQTYGRLMKTIDRFIGSRGFYTANVCNSEAGMEGFRDYPASYKRLLSVIHNSVEPADFSLSVNESREILNLPKDKLILTCVGRLHEQKNHELLVKTMKYVNDAVLYCAGDGPLRDHITSLIEKENVQDRVFLMGDLEREQVRQLLRASDVFVIPSKYEGLSNSLIEAMSYGLPIVFSNIPSFTSFLKLNDEDKFAGVLVKSDDEKEWASQINKLIGHQDLMERYGRMSLDKVSSLSAEKMSRRFLDLIIK